MKHSNAIYSNDQENNEDTANYVISDGSTYQVVNAYVTLHKNIGF